jgi:Spy/CpxP family protein refolding chaperone
MEANMKKYRMIMLYILMVIFLTSPFTLKADKGMYGRNVTGKGTSMGRWQHDWFSYLNLDDDVLKKIQEMRLESKENMLELKIQIEKKELEMEKVLLEEKIDFKKVLSIHDEIADLQQKFSKKRIEQNIEMYKLIPEDKKEEAKKIFLYRFFGRKGHKKTGMPGRIGEPGCPWGK